jgi:regulator of sigma E protease
MLTILATVVVLGVLIFVHELGHFAAAKLVDIEVPRFSIGLGPRMFGFTRGETEYVVSWLPLGGYVKMAGMEEMEAIEGGSSKKTMVTGAGTAVDLGVEVEEKPQAGPRDFESKSLPARTLVISAGVIMNFLFAFFVFTLSSMIWGVRVNPETRLGGVAEDYLPAGTEALAELPRGAHITAINQNEVKTFDDLHLAVSQTSKGNLEFTFANHAPVTIAVPASEAARDSLAGAFEPEAETPPVIGQVTKDSPANRAGLRPGDRIISAGGQPTSSWQQFVTIVENNPGKAVPITLKRGDTDVSLTVTPESRSLRGKRTYGRVGVAAQYSIEDVLPRDRPGPIGAIKAGAERTWDVVSLTAGFLWQLITGQTSARNVGGPILIGKLSGQVARLGLEAFLSFMALFSVNLAVLNLLPIPVLDGGHLMFLGVEAVRGRPLSLNQRMKLSQVGFVIIVAIMVWAVANDVLRLFGV